MYKKYKLTMLFYSNLIILLFIYTGCGDVETVNVGSNNNVCETNFECGQGFECYAGVCHAIEQNKTCENDNDCRDGQVCSSGICGLVDSGNNNDDVENNLNNSSNNSDSSENIGDNLQNNNTSENINTNSMVPSENNSDNENSNNGENINNSTNNENVENSNNGENINNSTNNENVENSNINSENQGNNNLNNSNNNNSTNSINNTSNTNNLNNSNIVNSISNANTNNENTNATTNNTNDINNTNDTNSSLNSENAEENSVPCEEDGSCGYYYGDWSEWSVCSTACGEGVQTRTRSCLDKSDTVNDCSVCGGECEHERNCYGTLCLTCNNPFEGKLCSGNSIPLNDAGPQGYIYADNWQECQQACEQTQNVLCCQWIERNMGMCSGKDAYEMRDDFQGSTGIWVSLCD